MDRSLSFGSIIYDLSRPFQTRFRFGSVSYLILNLAIYNNSPDRSTKSTTSPLKWLCLLVNIRFQVLFTPLPGFFSTFPHGTAPLSVTKQYLALRDGPRVFIQDSTCLALLWILPCQLIFRILDFHYLWYIFPDISTKLAKSIMQSEPLKYYYSRFGLFLFRSPLLKESIFLSFPVGTKMFQFPTFPPNALLYLCAGNQTILSSWVSPFRYLWINGYLLLPIAFRSLSRLSSALGAQAFNLFSLQLNLILKIFG